MKPVLITIREKIRGVPAAWRKSYGPESRGGKWYASCVTDDREATYNKLVALDLETATADDIKAIIGNSSWTDLACDGCARATRDAIVRVGEDPNVGYESSALLCPSCIEEAAALVRSEGKP